MHKAITQMIQWIDAHDSDGYVDPLVIDDNIKGKRTRGPIGMHEITRIYNEGHRIVVQYNEMVSQLVVTQLK